MRSFLGFVVFSGILLGTVNGLAQPLRFHGSAAGAHALAGHQKDEFGFGVAVLPAAELALSDELGAQLELGWVWLSEGDAPKNPALEPLGDASALTGLLGLRYRPFATAYEGKSAGMEGIWMSAGLGLAHTGDLNRFMFDAQLGFDWFPSGSQLGVGPMLGYLHVTQPDDARRPSDASLLLFGLHVGYDLQERKEAIVDRDGDGILDDVDKCPDDPEDKDGFEDEDGCPDPDNDQDTILDQVDQCPLVPEDKDGFLDKDGCPDPDNDKDGILDKADKCPMVPEDKDDFEDEDGCPDDDNDQDGIVDAKDLCPNEPETQNGYADQDGCPDEQQVRVVGDRIMLDDKVHFRTNSHIIRPLSYPLLDQLWKLISEHPEYTHVEIEGHADQRGDANFNKALSQRRAESVMAYLIKRGLEESRLSAVGYGSERPLVDQRSEYAWLLNRRVEFAVTREKKTTIIKDSAPKPAAEPAVGGSR